MSVKEIKILNKFSNGQIEVKKEGDNFKFDSSCMGMRVGLTIDRNQAHLLMLYLQEHLGYAEKKATS